MLYGKRFYARFIDERVVKRIFLFYFVNLVFSLFFRQDIAFFSFPSPVSSRFVGVQRVAHANR